VKQLRHPPLKPDAIGYVEFCNRSHDPVIRVYDEAGNVIETHEHKGEFKEWVSSLDPDLDRIRIELKRIRPKKCVFKGAIIGPNPR
jgi:hypothetical protein